MSQRVWTHSRFFGESVLADLKMTPIRAWGAGLGYVARSQRKRAVLRGEGKY